MENNVQMVQRRVERHPRPGDLVRGWIYGEERELVVFSATAERVWGAVRKRDAEGDFQTAEGFYLPPETWAEWISMLERFEYRGNAERPFQRIGTDPVEGDLFVFQGNGNSVVEVLAVSAEEVRFSLGGREFSVSREQWKEKFQAQCASGNFLPLRAGMEPAGNGFREDEGVEHEEIIHD